MDLCAVFPPDRVAQKVMSEENMQNIMVLCVILALMEVGLAGSFCIVLHGLIPVLRGLILELHRLRK